MLITVTTIPMISSAIKRDSSIHVFPVCTTSKKYRKFQFIIGWEPTAIRLIMLFVDLFIAYITRTYNRFLHLSHKKKIYTPKVVVKAVEKDEPTVTDTLEMSALTATKANELTATFTNAVASTSAITIKVNKAGSTTAISGTTKWSEDATSVVFTATANLTAGTYEMTATDSTDATKTTTKTVAIENERVEEIKILNDVALTNSDKDTAYIYYDVLNQYGESLKESTTITWTVSSDQNPKINKAAGKITAKRHDGKDYTYGELLYVTGVYSKNGKSIQKQLTIGMEQSLDTVKTVGFVKDSDKNTILDKLPANFQAGQYKMLYETYDQNGNPIDAVANNIANNNVTFISDNVLLLKNDFKDGGIYTIKGVEYASVTIEPGQYVDKGGEVNITAISNKTGKKTIMNYVIGGTPILKSLVLSQPAEVVADGESHDIPFVATDVDGNQITNYESIVRTTNTLSLTASDNSILSVQQKNDGTAKVVWTDDPAKKATNSWGSETYDDIDRSVALTTVVVGGDSNNLILQVSDKARPVAVKSATLRTDATTAIVENDTDTLDLSDFVFVDQYGRAMDSDDMKAQAIGFFKNSVDAGGWNKAYYGVKAEFNKNGSAFTSAQISTGAAVIITGSGLAHVSNVANSVTWTSNNITSVTKGAIATQATVSGKEKIESVKYSVVSISTADAAKIGSVAASDFDYVGKALNVSYSVVPMKEVTNISIKSLNKQYISLGLENKSSGAEAGMAAGDLPDSIGSSSKVTSSDIKVKTGYEQPIKLTGSYNGVALVIPSSYATFKGDKFDFGTGDTIQTSTVSTGALKLGDFFDASKANFVRKDGSDTISATVSMVTSGALTSYIAAVGETAGSATAAAITKSLQQAEPKATLTFSDANPVPTKVQVAGETATFWPTDTVLDTTDLKLFGLNADSNGKQKLNADGSYNIVGNVYAEDQYSQKISGCNWTYSISDVKENAGDFAHLDKSFAINANDTDAVSVKGAELGDTFVIKYTASKNGGSASVSVKVTVGSDAHAWITNGGDYDKTFRTGILNYAY